MKFRAVHVPQEVTQNVATQHSVEQRNTHLIEYCKIQLIVCGSVETEVTGPVFLMSEKSDLKMSPRTRLTRTL